MASVCSASTVSLPPYSMSAILAARPDGVDSLFGADTADSVTTGGAGRAGVQTPALEAGEEPLPTAIRSVQTPADSFEAAAAEAAEEAALRAAVESYKQQEGAAGDKASAASVVSQQGEREPTSTSVAGGAAAAPLDAIVKRQGDDRLALLRRYEGEVAQVKASLERQIGLQVHETERVKAQQQANVDAMVAGHQREVDAMAAQPLPPAAKQTELHRLEDAHSKRVSVLQAQHAETLSAMQLQAMHFMRQQEEELSRLRDLHHQTLLQQKANHERELEAHVRVQQLSAAAFPPPPPPAPIGLPAPLPPAVPALPYPLPPPPMTDASTYVVPSVDFAHGKDTPKKESAWDPADASRATLWNPPPTVETAPLAPEVESLPAPQQLHAHGDMTHSARDLATTTSPPVTGRLTLASELPPLRAGPPPVPPLPIPALTSPALREPSVAAELLARELEGLGGRAKAAEQDHQATLAQFETEISGKKLEINHIKGELQRKALTGGGGGGAEDQIVLVGRLQDLLGKKERELDALVDDYRVAKLEMNRSMLELKSNLRVESLKADEIRQQLGDVTTTLMVNQERQLLLEKELEDERRRARDASRAAADLQPEVSRWRLNSEAAQHTTNLLLESQSRFAADLTEMEGKRRKESVGILKTENDELKGMVAFLTDRLNATQKSISLAETNSKHWRELVDDLAGKVRDAQEELGFSNQAIATLSSRNQELETLHMSHVVRALDHKYFGGDAAAVPLPQRPQPSVEPQRVCGLSGSPPNRGASAPPELLAARETAKTMQTGDYGAMVDTLARYLGGPSAKPRAEQPSEQQPQQG
eukprot:TRINITY_DN15403_c0_g1_i1.p2 TRINITY_DN15403_c0_g1~~TRINITY_DN15403_c0_g1_i1.p2  ORF type:complete len:842 (+),score=346.94 TRINITY_DN15403_c0_g1_i1:65-2527(+)